MPLTACPASPDALANPASKKVHPAVRMPARAKERAPAKRIAEYRAKAPPAAGHSNRQYLKARNTSRPAVAVVSGCVWEMHGERPVPRFRRRSATAISTAIGTQL